MLTPKKVFVDTITTQCDLMLPDLRMGGVQNSGPPRATRFLIPNSEYQDKGLHGLYLPTKDILVVEGSVIGYMQGHNVFGPCDVPNLVLESYKAAHITSALPLGKDEKRGLDEVLVAAELALERAGPGGRISPEHVANVLARLTAPERPPNVATPLSTSTPVQADPGRYDRLRRLAEQEADHG